MLRQPLIWMVILLVLACGGALDAGQVGMRIDEPMPIHGHSGPNDGGTIKLPALRANSISSQTITCSGVATKATQISSVTIDNKGWYDTGSSRYTPQIAGYYLTTVSIRGNASTTFTNLMSRVCKNGTDCDDDVIFASLSNTTSSITVTAIKYMNGTTDYLEAWGAVNGTGTCAFYPGTMFQVVFVSR